MKIKLKITTKTVVNISKAVTTRLIKDLLNKFYIPAKVLIIITLFFITSCGPNEVINDDEIAEEILEQINKPVYKFEGDQDAIEKYDCKVNYSDVFKVIDFFISGEIFEKVGNDQVNTFRNPDFYLIEPEMEEWWKSVFSSIFNETNRKFEKRKIILIDNIGSNYINNPVADTQKSHNKLFDANQDKMYRVMIHPLESINQAGNKTFSKDKIEIIFQNYSSDDDYIDIRQFIVNYNYLYILKLASPNGEEKYQTGDVVCISWYSNINNEHLYFSLSGNSSKSQTHFKSDRPILVSKSKGGRFNEEFIVTKDTKNLQYAYYCIEDDLYGYYQFVISCQSVNMNDESYGYIEINIEEPEPPKSPNKLRHSKSERKLYWEKVIGADEYQVMIETDSGDVVKDEIIDDNYFYYKGELASQGFYDVKVKSKKDNLKSNWSERLGFYNGDEPRREGEIVNIAEDISNNFGQSNIQYFIDMLGYFKGCDYIEIKWEFTIKNKLLKIKENINEKIEQKISEKKMDFNKIHSYLKIMEVQHLKTKVNPYFLPPDPDYVEEMFNLPDRISLRMKIYDINNNLIKQEVIRTFNINEWFQDEITDFTHTNLLYITDETYSEQVQLSQETISNCNSINLELIMPDKE